MFDFFFLIIKYLCSAISNQLSKDTSKRSLGRN